MKPLIETLIRPDIRALRAYHVPDAAGLIKLDAMENPYGWPEVLREDWLAALRKAELNRYPDPQGRDLLVRAAEKFRLSARGYHRVMRVARTIADLDHSADVHKVHVAEAISFRVQGS